MKPNSIGYGCEPGHYTAYRASGTITPDGRAQSPAWAKAPRTPRFVEMVSGAPAPLGTEAAILWDEKNLYIAFWVEEPYPVATMTKRDDCLFFENDLEIFIDGGESYYEYQVNALGVIYEVMYIWRTAFEKGGKWDRPPYDVFHPRSVTYNGDYRPDRDNFWYGSHPKGPRWAFLDYDLPGLQTFVHVDGKVNDPSTPSKGWTAEIVIPWAGLGDLANGRALPPRPGDVWGILLARFQQLQGRNPGTSVSAGYSAHPMGVADTHTPETFTQVTFSDKTGP